MIFSKMPFNKKIIPTTNLIKVLQPDAILKYFVWANMNIPLTEFVACNWNWKMVSLSLLSSCFMQNVF